MNKRILLFSFIVNIFVLSPCSYADSIERADQVDIKMLLNAASGVNSAYWASYIGETRDRVYIEYTTLVHASSIYSDKPKYIVYWIPRSELSIDQLRLFKEYKDKLLRAE